MTLASLRRCEPSFDDSREAASAPVSSPPAASPVAAAPAGVAVLPWIGLALAALVLAVPALRAQPAEALDKPTVAPAANREPRLADEDEVVAGRFTLRLAGASSADDLWRRWSEMKQRRLGLFDDLSAAVAPAGGPGTGYVLLVGDFRNAGTASEACGTLRARFLACDVVHRDGSALAPQA